ncbi:MAG: hypothetical protein PHE17_19195 [Thiothrix sp.]|jgi:hypothetical protein|uniref:hypothetical protein n=1 Tax=Thiothrix sp. TaxID=1032 RepID=UPI0026340F07|nr:hypothetical protein [Thiothrix sp.]MDD5395153.1 hypothetical protein [Thiothrix sp.]
MPAIFDWKHYISRKFLTCAAIVAVALIKVMRTDDYLMAGICFGAALATIGIYIYGNIKAGGNA